MRSVKRCLKKAIGLASLSFGELHTLLVEIEATLNNRPLTFVYDDEQSVSHALTPSHLIYGRQISSVMTSIMTLLAQISCSPSEQGIINAF